MSIPVSALYPSIGRRAKLSGDVDVSGIDKAIGLDTSGFALFCGDDTGAVHRWEVSGQSLQAVGLFPIGPQLRSDSFVERRLPKRESARHRSVMLLVLSCKSPCYWRGCLCMLLFGCLRAGAHDGAGIPPNVPTVQFVPGAH